MIKQKSGDTARNKTKWVKIAIWCILGAILLFICVVVGTLLVEKYVKKAAIPMFAGYGSSVVLTGSMNGTIDQGDMIIIKKTNDYRLGDIVTFVEAEGKTPVTHRIINYGPEEGTFITKGDANNTADISPISEDKILGEVVCTIPKIGAVVEWFAHGGGIIYVAAIVIVVIACAFFWDKVKSDKDKDDRGAQAQGDATQPTIGGQPTDEKAKDK